MRLRAILLLFLTAAAVSCGGGSSNPVPAISSLSPSNKAAGAAAFTLTVNGSGFINSSKVRWNGNNRTTTYVSSSQIRAAIASADIANIGTASVTVKNPSPGGGTSAASTFTVNPLNPVPAITSLNPAAATAGDPAFALTVNGTGFVSNSTVRWNGSARTTTYVSATRLTAAVSAADIATAGTASVTVVNPAPGGGTSAASTFTVNPLNPVPAITSLNPAAATAGDPAFALTVNGTGFVSSSTVRWNGSARTTTFVSATRLTAAVSAADIATAGAGGIQVVNPAPGGGTSNTVIFTINPRYPIVEDLGAIQQNAMIRGRDGLFSALIDGKSCWTFGDTSLNGFNASGLNFFSNSLSWTDNLNASNGIFLNHDYLDSSQAPTQFIPLTDDEVQFNSSNKCPVQPGTTCGEEYAVWNGPLIPVPNSNFVYTFYGLVKRGGQIDWFNVMGNGIALWDRSTMTTTRPVVAPGTAHPTLMWQEDPTYNDGALLEGNYVYTIGCKTDWIVKNCRIGRAQIDSVFTRSAWQYYTGDDGSGQDQWSSEASQAANVFQGGAAGNSLFWVPALQKYIVVYSGVFSNDVFYRTADRIWGPWSDQTKLFTGLENTYDDTADYAAMAHPEFAEQNGNVQYIAYVHITGFLQNDIRLVRVTFGPPAP